MVAVRRALEPGRGVPPDELGEAFWDRSVTRIAVMRGTIHLVTAADALVLPGLIAPLHAKDLRVNAQHAAALRRWTSPRSRPPPARSSRRSPG